MNPVLYSFRRCPYAMRARLAIGISGIGCDLREVRLSAKPQALAAASPKATVPVLVLPDGQVFDESLDIMRWALTQNDPEGWLTGDDASLIAWNDGPFKHALDRYKYPGRHEADPLSHRKLGLDFLRELNDRLAPMGQPGTSQPRTDQLCGPTRTLTDAAIMPFARQFAAVDRGWFDDQPLPRLKAWLADHNLSALFVLIMHRTRPWSPGDTPVALAPGLAG